MNHVNPVNEVQKEFLAKPPTFLTFYDLDSQLLLASRIGSAQIPTFTQNPSDIDNELKELVPVDTTISEEKLIISVNRSGRELDDLKALYTKRNIKSAPVRRSLITANSCYLNTGPLNICIKANKLTIPSRPTTAASRKSKYSDRLSASTARQHVTSSNTADKENNNSNPDINSKMEGIEEDANQYHMKPLDNDTRQFSDNKKVINKQIKSYWKQDLSEIEKGKLRKLTNPTFDDSEWMTIKKPPNDNGTPKSNEPISLIDTFTADIQESDAQVDHISTTYKVSPTVGTMIANKIFNGEKIRVGVNGKFINDSENINDISFEKLVETDKFYDPASVLSWQQQIRKNDVKFISPTVNPSNANKIVKYDRNLVVKKLVDEEEFLPSYEKKSNSQLQSADTTSRLSVISERSQPTSKPRQSLPAEPRVREYRIPVEVIGTNSVGHPFQQHINNVQKSEPAITNAMRGTKKVELKRMSEKQRPVISLNEKNYTQLVDNLTQKYTDAVMAAKQQKEAQQQSQQHTNSLYVNMTNNLNASDKVKLNPNPKLNVNNEKCVSADFITRDLLGVSGVEPSKLVKNSIKLTQNSGQNSSNNNNNNNDNRHLPLVASKPPVFLKTNTNNNLKSIIHSTINNNTNASLLINPNQSTSFHQLNDTLNQSHEISLIQNTLDTNTIDTSTLYPTPSRQIYKNKDTDCLITIKSYHSTENGEPDLPITPMSYSSYTNSFKVKRPLINNFNTRAKISIETPNNLGYLNNFGHSPQLNSLGGGFYYNSSKKKNIPSGYFKYDRSKQERVVKSSCRLKSGDMTKQLNRTESGLETKYFQITKPIIRKNSHFSFVSCNFSTVS